MTDREEFEQLSNQYFDAVGAKDEGRAETILTTLEALQDRASNIDGLSGQINNFIINAAAGELAAAVKVRNEITESLGGLAEAFTKAAKEVKKAEENLFLNKLSTILKGVQKTIKAFKDRIEEIKSTFKSIDKPKNLKDVKAVLENIKTVKGVLKGLEDDLEGIKANFET